MKRLCLSIVLAVIAAASGAAMAMQPDPPPVQTPPPQQRAVRMNAKAAALPRPALRYRLLPSAVEQTPGNAATLWLMAIEMHRSLESKSDQIAKLLDTPFSQFDPADARRLTAGDGGIVSHASMAARRERCEWGLTIRTEGYNALLSHLNGMRSLAKLLALEVRLSTALGDYDSALRNLATGYSLARHLNSEGVLVQDLVAAGAAQLMSKRIEDLIQRPGAPNLYWALADLPRPFIDMRQAMQYERLALESMLPHLQDVRRGTPTAEQASRLINELREFASRVGGNHLYGNTAGQALMMVKLYPAAKRYVMERNGLSAEQVEAMPAQQVLAWYLVGAYDDWQDDTTKWAAFPYWQARDPMERAEMELGRARERADASPLLSLLPAWRRAYMHVAMVDRQIASLQCLEAVRAYAAAHDGKPPASLQNLAETPAPLDPITGQPFKYEVKDSTAIIDAPAPPGESPDRGWRYEMTISR